ncbi:MAG: hypothetical protein K2X82_21710 [Gemmataceae bacterium]|nr:hypothetical protein [Gemmataceae bacterium]
MTPIGYLTDEHTPTWWPDEVRRVAPAVRIVRVGQPGAPARGTLDPEVLLFCEANKLIWVTADRNTLYGHLADHTAAGHEFWGVMTLGEPITTEELVTDLILVYETHSAEDYIGVVQALPL